MSAVTTDELEETDLVSTCYGVLVVTRKYNSPIGLEVIDLQSSNGLVKFLSISDYGLRQIGAHPYSLAEQDRVEHD